MEGEKRKGVHESKRGKKGERRRDCTVMKLKYIQRCLVVVAL